MDDYVCFLNVLCWCSKQMSSFISMKVRYGIYLHGLLDGD